MKTWIKTLLPFLFFVVGFYATALLIRRETFLLPSVVGLTVSEAVLTFSKPTAQLVPRILAEREDDTVSPGTVLAQIPQPGQRVKAQQCVYLTVAKAQQKPVMPDLIGVNGDEAMRRVQRNRIKVKNIAIADGAPIGVVVAQTPSAGTSMGEELALLYTSTGTPTDLRIVPDLVGLPLDLAEQGATRHGFRVRLLDETRAHAGCVITAQRPLAGSIIDTTNPVTVQLQVA
ncbi:MAG: PASTA domain-containing protein [Candidatus Dependentiae bacterium]|nr:PASTA domain-containing protein [Candidatus Dependentiae bacterium]